MTQLAKDVGRTVFGTAVAGYGFSIGRDAWRSTKKHTGLWLFLVILCAALITPYIAAQRLVRFSGRGGVAWLICTLLGNLVLWMIGAALFCVAAIGLILGYAALLASTGLPDPLVQRAGNVPIWILATGALAIVSLAGLAHGLLIRPKRVRAARVQAQNEQFLIDHGINETGGDEVTHVDAQDNRLRLLEINTREAIFLAVGRRGKRAYIRLDDRGFMREYSAPE